MADISKIEVNETTYNVKDATARNRLVPTGGTTGQVLKKRSSTNNDVVWGSVSGIPTGGTTGQVLTKKSEADGDVGWYTPGSTPTGNDWYLPTGLLESNVIAAYKFVGQESEASALTNVNNGTSYLLTKSTGITWSSANGFYIPATAGVGLYNASLNEQTASVRSAVFSYHGYSMISPDDREVYMPGMYMKTANALSDASNWDNRKALAINWIGDKTVYGIFAGTGNSETAGALAGARNSSQYSAGVLGCNYNGYGDVSLYYNGAGLSGTSASNYLSGASSTTITLGQLDYGLYNTPYYVKAFVLFNTVLTAAQHLELYNSINALGSE